MPPRPVGAPPPMTEEQTAQLLLQMAQSSQRLTGAVATLATSQAPFMRSAADADANIGLSKSQAFVHHEVFAAQRIDNTVRPLSPSPYNAAVPKGPAFSFLNYYWTNNTEMGLHLLRETLNLFPPTTMNLTISLTLVMVYLARARRYYA